MKWFLAACSILLLPLCPRASAWSAPGHMIVAALAYDQLAPAERAKFDAILRDHAKYATWEKLYPASGLPGLPFEKFAAMLASLYPDEIRNHDNPETFPEWHYIDYPLIPPDFPMKPAPTPGDDILTGIEKSAKAVRGLTKSFDTRARAKMLSFLLHLVGDIHQPMHCETLFDENFHEPDGDRGGNNAWVKPPGGSAIRLHAFWDQLFGTGGQLFRPVPLTMVLAAEHRAKDLAARFPRSALPELAAHTIPASWSLESRALAVSDGWRRHKLAYGLTEATAAELPADYEEKAHAIADRQVALAGHRLADQLHEVLK
ncbi:MAG: S1/P1 nuclease [Chthoniobacteraceae bacterium]